MSLKHFNKTQDLFGKNKEKIVFFISLIMMIISSSISVYAANYLYSSSEVSFDNSSSGISSDNVQGAIDELYQNASDYSSLDSRIGALEGRWKNSPESYFQKENTDEEWLHLNNTSSKNGGYTIDDSSGSRSMFFYNPSNDTTYLDANSNASSGRWGKGKLNIRGNPVMVNGKGIELKSKIVEIGNITLNSNGFVDISSFKPSGMNNFLFASINYWGSVNPKAAFLSDSSGRWILGTANQTITGLKVEYFYTD